VKKKKLNAVMALHGTAAKLYNKVEAPKVDINAHSK
jgi:hypothetical protein